MNLSIIVPVYNIEKYLDKCLNSLVNQTLDNYEVIIINDGATDKSFEIIDKYKNKYPNLIKAYTKENGGLSSARNYGIQKATGKYIAFLDGDDYVCNDTYKKLYDEISSKNLDMVICDLFYTYENNKKTFKVSNKKSLKNNKLFLTNVYPVVWNKIYKTEIIKKFEFKKGILFEDVEFIHRVLPYIKSIGYIKEPLINYVQREGSITYKFNNKIWDYFGNLESIITFYKKENIYDEYKEEITFIYLRYIYGTFIKQAVRSKDLKVVSKAYKDAVSNRKKLFPKYRTNKYLYKKGFHGFYLLTFNKLYVYLLLFFNKVSI